MISPAMRVALIADIHANMVAFDAVLDRLSVLAIDHYVCLGDVCASGPQPLEVARRLEALGCLCVLGNADAGLPFDAVAGDGPVGATDEVDFARRIADIDAWCASRLDERARSLIASFAPTHLIDTPAGALLAYHGSPESFDEPIAAETPDDRLDAFLDTRDARFFAGGHTHVAMVRRRRSSFFLNPGSVGMAYDPYPPRETARQAPWAECGVLDLGPDAFSIQLLRVPFDGRAVAEAAHRSGMPHAAWWASDFTDRH